ncbi:hypothetical protein Aduo_015507 [Ancylostoma duodenale]
MERLRLCTINIRSIATEARPADFESSVENIKFDVMGLSETRIAGKGRIDFAKRLIEICIKLRDGTTLRVIQVHAPHSDFQVDEYEAFLDNLADSKKANTLWCSEILMHFLVLDKVKKLISVPMLRLHGIVKDR